ncbi:MAG: ribose-phosphate pyrophosphokinase [Bacteroidetes bacterium]|nr:MAG: ribose-phosphate pyrophosphokinase [Bacteroidota bacterium]MBL1143519.1 ribose-phosphate pyrophosphokinase [Bacteroidota bacterium]NOG56321.1 ribose-phosphate pyrophosphokinase [Bacteroidota bacterium]
MTNEVKIFSGSASKVLAESIAEAMGKELGKSTLSYFSDGEFQPAFEESVRGCDVFIIQSTPPPTDKLFELLLMVDAAKRASAKRIVAVIPYFGFARQDRKDQPRVPIGSKLIANMLTAAGVSRVMTMDLHADQIQGFFEVPVDHLYASAVFSEAIKELKLPNLIMASPDMGGSKRAYAYAKHLECDVVVCYKQRKKANQIDKMFVIGEVEGKDVVLIDDMVDTAGTLTKAANIMMEKGANSVRAICTHAILSGQAYERIEQSALTELIVTDSIPLKQESDKIRVVSVAKLFGKVINAVHNYESISSNFIF